jgi:hypothetical protein
MIYGVSAVTEDNTDQHDSPFVLSDVKEKLMVTDLINQLDIADGLKELLINSGITLRSLLNTSGQDFAKLLGIDLYVAKLVSDAVNKAHKSVTIQAGI